MPKFFRHCLKNHFLRALQFSEQLISSRVSILFLRHLTEFDTKYSQVTISIFPLLSVVFVSFEVSRLRNRCMMQPLSFVIALLISAPVLMTRWFRPQEAVYKISQKAALQQQHPKKPRLNLPMWLVQALENFFSITKTIYASVNFISGKKSAQPVHSHRKQCQ